MIARKKANDASMAVHPGAVRLRNFKGSSKGWRFCRAFVAAHPAVPDATESGLTVISACTIVNVHTEGGLV